MKSRPINQCTVMDALTLIILLPILLGLVLCFLFADLRVPRRTDAQSDVTQTTTNVENNQCVVIGVDTKTQGHTPCPPATLLDGTSRQSYAIDLKTGERVTE